MTPFPHDLPLTRFRYFVARRDYLNWLASPTAQSDRRRRESALVATMSGEIADFRHAPAFFCAVHGGYAAMRLPPDSGDASSYNWREGARCMECGASARIRLAAEWLLRGMSNHVSPLVYLCEQLTPLYRTLRKRVPSLIGSEYAPDARSHALAEARLRAFLNDDAAMLRHEDVCALSFSSQSLTHVGSFDVLEHVPDYLQALREFHRVLTDGGQLLLTVPFLPASDATVVRATLGRDGIEHLLPPEYHGNPTEGNDGVLCYYHFGWDLLDALRTVGFRSVAMLDAWNPAMALFDDQIAIVATR